MWDLGGGRVREEVGMKKKKGGSQLNNINFLNTCSLLGLAVILEKGMTNRVALALRHRKITGREKCLSRTSRHVPWEVLPRCFQTLRSIAVASLLRC